MTTAAPITALRAVRDLLVDHGDATLLPVARAIDDWLANGGSFAGALGLPPTWRSDARRSARDAALLRLARQHFPNMAVQTAALAIAAAARRYEGTAWPRDRQKHRRPDGLRGEIFDVLSLGDMPSVGTMCRILNGLSYADGPVGMSRQAGHAA